MIYRAKQERDIFLADERTDERTNERTGERTNEFQEVLSDLKILVHYGM